MCARKEGHKETIVNKQSKMRRALGSGVAGVAALAMLATGTAHAANGTYYSSKQPYIVPQQALDMSYSAAPEGYTITYTEMLARHGSRGLSSYKYDALLKLMGQTASEVGGFVSEEAEQTFMANVQAIIDANVENGYGMLTGQGVTQHQGIGSRAYQRNKQLFDQAAADGETIEYESSGEPRATESGENFKKGFDQASGSELAGSYVTPTAPAGEGDAAPFQKSPDTLYFHKTDNPDGSEKTGEAADIASRYENFVENNETIANAEDYIENVDASVTVSYDLLSQIFTEDFLEKVDDGTYSWYNTTTGAEDADEDGHDDVTGEDIRNCAIAGDPDELMAQYGEDICGETGKHITSVVDAAMDLYNLYIIAADMQEENTGDHTFDFDQYFADVPAEEGDVFAWILDMEDFYEKGPSYAGQDETYRIAQPLLDDFFASIDERVAGGDTAATFRFRSRRDRHAVRRTDRRTGLHTAGSGGRESAVRRRCVQLPGQQMARRVRHPNGGQHPVGRGHQGRHRSGDRQGLHPADSHAVQRGGGCIRRHQHADARTVLLHPGGRRLHLVQGIRAEELPGCGR